MAELARQQKITFAEMRAAGVRAADLLLGPSLQPLDDHERGPMAG
jgi:hypothetical protein